MGKPKGKNSKSENVRVVVRVRDLLPKEISEGEIKSVQVNVDAAQVSVRGGDDSDNDQHRWTFDAVYDNRASQKELFQTEVQPLVDSVFDGFNATVFAYGQSGSGKTYTMTGALATGDETLYGMMPQAVAYIFDEIHRFQQPVDSSDNNIQLKRHASSSVKKIGGNKKYRVRVQYIEIYNGKCRDLLQEATNRGVMGKVGKKVDMKPNKTNNSSHVSSTNLEVKQTATGNFYVKDAQTVDVLDFDACMEQFNAGTAVREVASHALNDQSSRSHALFTITIECMDYEADPHNPVVMTSKLNLVDLAGSERVAKTGAEGKILEQGVNINLSLSALAAVIEKVVQGAPHIPYRGSPLTMLLKDSLGGNSKTAMFANCGPARKNVAETISTLRFADRAKQIKNKPQKNIDPKDAHLQELLERVAELQRQLQSGGEEDGAEFESLRNRIRDLEEKNALKAQLKLDEQLRLLEVQHSSGDGSTNDIEPELKQLEQKKQQLADATASVRKLELSRQQLQNHLSRDVEVLSELRRYVTNHLSFMMSPAQIEQVRSKILVRRDSKEKSNNSSDRMLDDDTQWSVLDIVEMYNFFSDAFEQFRLSQRKQQIVANVGLQKEAPIIASDALKVAEEPSLGQNDEEMSQLLSAMLATASNTDDPRILKKELLARADELAKLDKEERETINDLEDVQISMKLSTEQLMVTKSKIAQLTDELSVLRKQAEKSKEARDARVEVLAEEMRAAANKHMQETIAALGKRHAQNLEEEAEKAAKIQNNIRKTMEDVSNSERKLIEVELEGRHMYSGTEDRVVSQRIQLMQMMKVKGSQGSLSREHRRSSAHDTAFLHGDGNPRLLFHADGTPLRDLPGSRNSNANTLSTSSLSPSPLPVTGRLSRPDLSSPHGSSSNLTDSANNSQNSCSSNENSNSGTSFFTPRPPPSKPTLPLCAAAVAAPRRLHAW